ncbi:tRNA uridine-5-carboxymethylaminomethyl(34) synthesis GTPase MnmE [Tranquillimonas alkanivorans]|uniref:tRNA modification GTPase MnmE n=1 Tax=Tranquillimonas alkanivorans TaxID=441119 RepID=A0A1I5LHB7_9RHOB|nr:tRNA uridine-5-carboxymethylaminomethyl(34) synthesis GTPase MnmE [Tranquillimonas alkanivorans]SFO96583.1 tRNA modification GTPase trmE [Tranquillimonas alkanivorans]
MDTIYAPATARGKSGVAVIRISGPDAVVAAERLCGSCPPARQAGLRQLADSNGEILDQALVLRFEKGASFTGEEIVEFQVHGSVAIVGAVLHALEEVPGLRMAEPGEFTRRALENDRLDLTQVEGLADLIDAETEEQRKQAVRTFTGALAAKSEEWRQKLLRAAALLEATIDFADEEVPVDVTPEVAALIDEVRESLSGEIEGSRISERLRDGFEVAIVGLPNAGKSTLLNALAGRDAAITSDVAGTTRDVIEVRMDLKGLPVTFLDTAGVRKTADRVESLGVERAILRARGADLRVILISAPEEEPVMQPEKGDLLRIAKCDLRRSSINGISGKSGAGVSELLDQIVDTLSSRMARSATATNARQRQAMQKGLQSLSEAQAGLAGPGPDEIVAEDLRAAIRALDALVGRVDVEHILGEIFASFCIGK